MAAGSHTRLLQLTSLFLLVLALGVDIVVFSTAVLPAPVDAKLESPVVPLFIVVVALQAMLLIIAIGWQRADFVALVLLVGLSVGVASSTTYRPTLPLMVSLAVVTSRRCPPVGLGALATTTPAVIGFIINERSTNSVQFTAQVVAGLIVLNGSLLLIPYGIGAWRRRVRLRELTLVEDGAKRGRDAAAAERSRLARELHDVVSGNITVMTVSANAAGRLLRDDAAVRELLTNIERSGESASSGLYSLLRNGVVADDEPTIALTDIVQRYQRAGLEIEMVGTVPAEQIDGDVRTLLLRAVQEGLSNALKHADLKRPVHLALINSPGQLCIEITSHVAAAPQSDAAGAGLGIEGLTERASALGGDVTVVNEGVQHRLTVTVPFDAPTMAPR